jgi:hypothetical protein
VDFENALALALLRERHASAGQCLFLEDESRQIGALSVPLQVYRRMRETPVIVLEVPLEQRVSRLLDDYIRVDLEEHLALDAERGFETFSIQLEESLWRIRKRLGAERFLLASRLLQAALSAQRSRGETAEHRAWISLLLEQYYDPMYDYQLGNAAERVVFRATPPPCATGHSASADATRRNRCTDAANHCGLIPGRDEFSDAFLCCSHGHCGEQFHRGLRVYKQRLFREVQSVDAINLAAPPRWRCAANSGSRRQDIPAHPAAPVPWRPRGSAPIPEARSISPICPSNPKPVTSVQAPMPWRRAIRN